MFFWGGDRHYKTRRGFKVVCVHSTFLRRPAAYYCMWEAHIHTQARVPGCNAAQAAADMPGCNAPSEVAGAVTNKTKIDKTPLKPCQCARLRLCLRLHLFMCIYVCVCHRMQLAPTQLPALCPGTPEGRPHSAGGVARRLGQVCVCEGGLYIGLFWGWGWVEGGQRHIAARGSDA